MVAGGGTPPLLAQNVNVGKEMKLGRRVGPRSQVCWALSLGSMQGITAAKRRREEGNTRSICAF